MSTEVRLPTNTEACKKEEFVPAGCLTSLWRAPAEPNVSLSLPAMRGHYLLISPSAARAAAVTDIGDQLSVAAGRLVGGVPATAVPVRPDGHVAWASSQAWPDPDELRELR
jgi:hypothetical protein